jgi:hypothetical protein
MVYIDTSNLEIVSTLNKNDEKTKRDHRDSTQKNGEISESTSGNVKYSPDSCEGTHRFSSDLLNEEEIKNKFTLFQENERGI